MTTDSFCHHVTLLLAVLLVVSRAISTHAADESAPIRFHVALDGNDDWSGTRSSRNATGTDGPFATLEAARDAVRELKSNRAPRKPIEVLIHPGTYRRTHPLTLTAADSGNADCSITYKAFDQVNRPVLSGGRVVTGWRPYRDAIMQADAPWLKGNEHDVRQLFYDWQRLRRARWPNHDPDDPLYGGWAFIDEVTPRNTGATPAWHADTRQLRPDQPLARQWAKPHLGEVFVFPWLCWVNDIIPIESVDREAGTITMARSAWNTIMIGNRFRVENVLEELDEPGEWCLDHETGVIYLWPPNAYVEQAQVTVPVVNHLIELIGTEAEPVTHVRFEGLVLTQTLSLAQRRSYAVQSDGVALYMENAHHCRVVRCYFDQVGGDAIRLFGRNDHNQIVNNEIAYAGAQGICFFSRGEGNTHTWHNKLDVLRLMADGRPTATGNLVSANHIHHIGQIEKHGVGIYFFSINAVDNVVSHNLIHDVPRYGISLQIGLGGNTIEYNDIYRSSLETADTGAIETNRWFVLKEREPFERGNVFRFNRCRDDIGCGAYGSPRTPLPDSSYRAGGRIWAPYYSWGIYFDNSPMDVVVYGNITIGNVLGGVMVLGAGNNVLFENNILVDSSRSQVYLSSIATGGNYGPSRDIRFVRNIVYYHSPDALLFSTEGKSISGLLAESDHNVFFNASGGPLRIDIAGSRPPPSPEQSAESQDASDYSFEKWREAGHDVHSLVADPLFVDPAGGDYRLHPDSPALKLGFVPIPFDRIGPAGVPYNADTPFGQP